MCQPSPPTYACKSQEMRTFGRQAVRPNQKSYGRSQISCWAVPRDPASGFVEVFSADELGHHAVLSGALKSAVRKKLVAKNVCTMVDWRPHATKSSDLARMQAWTADEARRFLDVARKAGPQWGAFFALAIDSGMRRGELCGLLWNTLISTRAR